MLSEIAVLKVQIPMESFGLCSTDDLCVGSCGAGQWGGACRSCLCVPAGSDQAVGLGFGFLWLLTRAPLFSGHFGFGTGLINQQGLFQKAVRARVLVTGVGIDSDERWGTAEALPGHVLK